MISSLYPSLRNLPSETSATKFGSRNRCAVLDSSNIMGRLICIFSDRFFQFCLGGMLQLILICPFSLFFHLFLVGDGCLCLNM